MKKETKAEKLSEKKVEKSKNKKSTSGGLIIILIWIIGIASVFMLGFYVWKFYDHSFSETPADWGNFGDYIGSITGLLAFLGVLYSLSLSEKRAIKAEEESNRREERDIFYKLLGLYERQADIITKNKSFTDFTKNIQFLTITLFVFEDFVNNEKSDIKTSPELFQAHIEIAKAIKINMDTPVNIEKLRNDLKVFATEKIEKKDYMFMIEHPELKESILYIYMNNVIDKYRLLEVPSLSNFVYSTLNKMGDLIYSENEKELGQYFRTIYYLLQCLFEFKEGEKYAKLFRSQLSTPEISLLLYNLASSQSTSKTAMYYYKFDIFNNLNLEGFFLVPHLIRNKIFNKDQFFALLYNEVFSRNGDLT